MEQQPEQKESFKTELRYRILTAAIMIPVALGIIYLGAPIAVLMGLLIVIAMLVEWIRLTVVPFDEKPHVTLALLIFGFTYLGLSGFWMVDLLAGEEGWRMAYVILFMIWATDASAFFTGKRLGGSKLAPSISPNKTWSGFIAGMIVGSAVGSAAYIGLELQVFPIWLIPVLVLIAQLGDLLESKVKRITGVKDSSQLLPGHGGILDRLDSLLAVCFFMALWQGF